MLARHLDDGPQRFFCEIEAVDEHLPASWLEELSVIITPEVLLDELDDEVSDRKPGLSCAPELRHPNKRLVVVTPKGDGNRVDQHEVFLSLTEWLKSHRPNANGRHFQSYHRPTMLESQDILPKAEGQLEELAFAIQVGLDDVHLLLRCRFVLLLPPAANSVLDDCSQDSGVGFVVTLLQLELCQLLLHFFGHGNVVTEI
ncbi:MAG: hypothetical protein QG633_120 [Patescibacteria group bacterium]|nr:hypothetical protein [Patescibacteria group bacterium]